MASTADITDWILSLPPNADVFEALKSNLTNAVGNPLLTGPKKVVLWVLVGAHALVVALALVGVAIKYRRGGGWLFTRDVGNGFLRPSAAVPQLLFALYGLFFLITVPTCILVRRPSYGAYIFAILSYIPLGLAFHAHVWSTLGVSLSTSSPIAVGSPSSRKRSSLPSYIGFWTALLFVLCHVPIIAAVQVFRRRQQHSLHQLLESIDEAAARGSGLGPLVSVTPLYNELIHLSRTLFTLYRVEVGVYGMWAILWMLVYVPNSFRLFFTLRVRARRLHRSIKSLRVLDELITQDDLEACALEEAGTEHADPNNLSFSFARTPRLEYGAPRLPPLALSPLHSPISTELPSFPSPVSSPRSDTTIRGPASPRSEVTIAVWSSGRQEASMKRAGAVRSGSRLAEMHADLAKAQRTLATIVLQFIVSCSMVASFLPFCFLIVSGNAHLVTGGGYQIWIGWTFAAPALVSTSVFLFFATVGPASPNPSTPTSPSTAAATSPMPLMTEFTPVSPVLPSLLDPTTSPAKRHMPRSPTSSRRLARALRDFFEWPTNPLIRGSESAASSSSTIDISSRHGTNSAARPQAVEPSMPPPSAILGRAKGKARASSRPTTAESLVDPASALPKRAPPAEGHITKSSSSTSGGSVAMGLGFKEDVASEREGGREGRMTVQSWVPSVWARGMQETEESRRRSEELQRQESGRAE